MKIKIISIIIMLCFCLTSCGSDKKEDTPEKTTEITTETTVENVTEKETATEAVTEATTENTEVEITEEETEEQKQEVDYSPYYEIIEKAEAITGTEEIDFNPEETGALSIMLYESYFAYFDFGYTMLDLDGNGIDELIICENGTHNPNYPSESSESTICNIYTLKDGKIENVFYGWERNLMYLTKEGYLINQGSNGAAYLVWILYEYKDNQLIFKESIFSEEGNPDIVYYHSNVKYLDENAEEITQQEAFDYMDSFDLIKLDITPINRDKFELPQ